MSWRAVRAGPHDLRMVLASAAAAAVATNLPLSRLCHLFALAFEPTLRPDKVQEPFGPLMTFGNGERMLLPRDLAPGHLDLL